jgi:energy-coupling factor transport system ATP-binding protein
LIGPQEGFVIEVRDAFCLLDVGDRSVAALRGLDLSVAEGERVVIHGPNGSGKTTLLRLLIGEQPLAAGDAWVAGWPVGAARSGLARWRCENVGWIDQFAGRTLRPEFDVLDNVALQKRLLGASRTDARDAALEALELLGVGSLAERSIVGLSGGEAQRVAAAAAVVHRPGVLFADEPAGQLDLDNAVSLYTTLAKAAAGIGAALVMVSHDRRASLIADRVVRIRDGRTSETWRPSSSGVESLIVDRRGWVRLPADARRTLGIAQTVQLDVDETASTAVLRAAHGPNPTVFSVAYGPSERPVRRDRDVEFRRPAETDVPAGASAAVLTATTTVAATAELIGVRRSFDGRAIVKGISAAFPAGQVHLIRGRSGSGKSTLLRILVGLDDPDEGEVRVVGESIARLDRDRRALLRRSHVGMVLQEIHLAETSSLLDNLSIARAVRGIAADPEADVALLDRLGVGALGDRPAGQCSGGERQRAAIARAIVAGPQLMVFDEPTSQLDEQAAELVAGLLRELASSGKTVIVASHDPLLTNSADRILDIE